MMRSWHNDAQLAVLQCTESLRRELGSERIAHLDFQEELGF